MPSSFSGRDRTVPRQLSSAALPSLLLQPPRALLPLSRLSALEMTETKGELLRQGTSSSRENETERFLAKMFI